MVQYVSVFQAILHVTELLNIGYYIYGVRVINTLLNCIINKTRMLFL